MKNYVIKPGFRGMFSVEKETFDMDIVKNIYTHIDWVYVVPEDGVLKVPNNTEKDVKKGDIVISFYDAPYAKNPVIVINSDEWAENIRLESEYERQKEKNKNKPCDADCCENCPHCSDEVKVQNN